MLRSTLRRIAFRKLLSRLSLALALQAMLACAPSVDGSEAFRRAREALKHAQSWRYTYLVRQLDTETREERRVEVVCPSRLHMQGQFTYAPGNTPSSTYDSYFLEGISYDQEYQTHRWIAGKNDILSPEATCQNLAEGKEAFPFPDFGALMISAKIEKGAEKSFGGEKCQEWRAHFRGPALTGRDEEICLGTDDFLPRHRVCLFGEMTYSDWNVPFVILPPLRDF